MTRTTITQVALAMNPKEIIDRVQHGEVVIVETSGKEQAVLLNSLDFRLLRALAHCAIPDKEREQEEVDPDVRILGAYLAGEISLGKAAELLDLSRFELQERCLRLGVPLRLGPATLAEAWEEIRAARLLSWGA
jgi:predicted HTH domain antitoxin